MRALTAQPASPGVLLVASGELERSMFRRSVVLLYEHSPRGARGVILSQPLPAFDPRLAGSAGLRAPVSSRTLLRHFHGGPVGMLGVQPSRHTEAQHLRVMYMMEAGMCA